LKKVLDKGCDLKDEKELKEKMEKKTEALKLEHCKLKDYMNLKSLKEVRDIFRVRTNFVEGFKGNFKNRYKHTTTATNNIGNLVYMYVQLQTSNK
jgi:hypothetical protein